MPERLNGHDWKSCDGETRPGVRIPLSPLPMAAKGEYTMLEVAGHEVRLSNPGKVYFPKPGWT